MSDWAELEDEMSDVLDDTFGEPIRHYPMVTVPNQRPTVDPDRAIQTTSAIDATQPLTGIFEWMSAELFLGKGHASSRAPPAANYSSRKPTLYIEVRQFVSGVRKGDRFAIVNRNLVLEVQDVAPDGQGRLCLHCNQIARHEVSE